MYAEERQQFILDRARHAGHVDVAELAATLTVTAETVRRDLTVLERSGHLRRVHGGAIPLERLGLEAGMAARHDVWPAEKERIAVAALDEVPAGGAILIDAGTTTSRLAESLPGDREITVATNSLPIALILAAKPAVTVLVIGGRVRGRTLATVGEWALRPLTDTFVDVAFIGTSGISADRGLTTPDVGEASVKRAMIGASRRTVVLADHSKVGVDHFCRFGVLADVDTIITDLGLNTVMADELADHGPRVVRA